MNIDIRSWSLIAAGCVFLGVGAQAQTPTRESDTLKMSLSGGGEWSDNRDSVADKDKESNLDLYLTPTLEAAMKWEISSLAFSYSPTFRHRTNPSDIQNENQFFHDLKLDYRRSLSRNLKARLIELFNVTDDPSVQKEGATLRRDSSFIYSQTEAGAGYSFDRLTTLDLSGRYSAKRYDEKDRQIDSDSTKTEGVLVFWRQPGRSFGLLGVAMLAANDYKQYQGIERGFDSVILGGGVKKQFAHSLSGELRAGAQMISYADPSLESETAPYAAGQLTAGTSPTRLTLTLSHMIRDAYAWPFASQKQTTFTTRVDWDSPNPDFRVAFNGTYRRGEYSRGTIPSAYLAQYQTDPALQSYASYSDFNANGGQETAVILSGELAYKLAQDLSIRLVQSYENVDSDVSISFNRLATNLSLSKEF